MSGKSFNTTRLISSQIRIEILQNNNNKILQRLCTFVPAAEWRRAPNNTIIQLGQEKFWIFDLFTFASVKSACMSNSSYLQVVWLPCPDELRHQEVSVEKVHILI